MNKRLLLALYDRSGLGAYMPVDYKGHELVVEEHIEKFAELIVSECLEVVEKQLGGGNGDGVEWDRAIDFTYEDMKKHFGVEL